MGGGVALLAEGVDRNTDLTAGYPFGQVALLAEGVDRNKVRAWDIADGQSRPPRGGRG